MNYSMVVDFIKIHNKLLLLNVKILIITENYVYRDPK